LPTAGVDEEGVGGAEAAGTSGAAFGAAWNVGAGCPPAFLNRN